MPIQKARFYSWTLNNYDEAELDALRTGLSQEAQVRYAIFGFEIGKEGTPHLQGYIAFKQQKGLTACKKVLSIRAHVEVCKGNEKQNIAYCKKGEQSKEEWKEFGTTGPNYGLNARFEEFGTPQREAGKRNDLKEFQEFVKADVDVSLKRVREEFPEVAAKYPRYIEQYIRDNMPKPTVEKHTLVPWQQELLTYLKGPVDPRKIICCIDPDGEAGKSWFCDYYEEVIGNSYLCMPGKHADMAYAFYSTCSSPRVIFIDLCKSRCDKEKNAIFPYEFMESAKNGRMQNTKYTSEMFYFKKPHVVLFANEYPDEERFAQNRIEHIDCSKQH